MVAARKLSQPIMTGLPTGPLSQGQAAMRPLSEMVEAAEPPATSAEPADQQPKRLLLAKWEVAQHAAIMLANIARVESPEVVATVTLQPEFHTICHDGDMREVGQVVDALVARIHGVAMRCARPSGTSDVSRAEASRHWYDFKKVHALLVERCQPDPDRAYRALAALPDRRKQG